MACGRAGDSSMRDTAWRVHDLAANHLPLAVPINLRVSPGRPSLFVTEQVCLTELGAHVLRFLTSLVDNGQTGMFLVLSCCCAEGFT
jgi:hypothetical protein